jgi:hypothetical protein
MQSLPEETGETRIGWTYGTQRQTSTLQKPAWNRTPTPPRVEEGNTADMWKFLTTPLSSMEDECSLAESTVGCLQF